MDASIKPDLFDTYMLSSLLKETGGRGNGYVNDPADHGGETVWGITVARARAAGYTGAMCDMTKLEALAIYRLYYYRQPGFDLIAPISAKLAGVLLDFGINFDPHIPSMFLQRGLNVLNQGGADYADITMDGSAGAGTRYALNAYLAKRGAEGERVLLALIAAFAAVRYVEIAEHTGTQERFEFGWLSNRAFPKSA